MTAEEEKAAQEAEAKAREAAAAAAAAVEAEKKKQTALPDDPAALRALAEKALEEKRAANAEAAKHRKRVRELEEKSLAESGKHRELAEARGKELETLRAEADQLREFKTKAEQQAADERARRDAQVAAEFAQLPEAVRVAVPADADATTKSAAIAAYHAAKGSVRPSTSTVVAPKVPDSGDPQKPTSDELIEMNYIGTAPERKAELRGKFDRYLKSLK